MSSDYSKHHNQLDLFDPDEDGKKKILIVGAWGIGSTTAYALAQMGFQFITVVDFDEVELHNTASQFYRQDQLGVMKVEALKQNIKDFTGVEITAICDKFKPEMTKGMDIVIMGVDVMEIRKQIAEACGMWVTRFIDCRMQGSAFEIHNFIPELELDMYMKTRFPDSEASQVKCTEKSISYNCLAIAAVIARICKGIARWEEAILDRNNWQVCLHNLIIW